jgi:carbonic anhydrase
MDKLIAGYRRFKQGDWGKQRARWAELAEGQKPRVLIIACCDSRVEPAQIFDIPPGDAFIIRNVANLVPPYEVGGGRHGVSAAVEFAVTKLEVASVIILGHAQCGGVAAAMARTPGVAPAPSSFIDDWISLLDPVHMAGCGHDRQAFEEAGVKLSLANLRCFPFVRAREAAGKLSLHGAHFGIKEGELKLLDEASGGFVSV